MTISSKFQIFFMILFKGILFRKKTNLQINRNQLKSEVILIDNFHLIITGCNLTLKLRFILAI